MSSDNFYVELPILADFSSTSDFSNYSRLPEDWHVVVADVEDSTGAIAAGDYKAVNILGVSIITSIFNIAKPMSIPSIFGGDGAALCIPERLVDAASSALVAVKGLAQEEYHLNLRVGIVPATVVSAAGYQILVARHRMSSNYIQAAFAGGGIEYAEGLLKDEKAGRIYRLDTQNDAPLADFSGLECRWDNVPSKHGEVISLIVKALSADMDKQSRIYNEIIAEIEAIYGKDEISQPLYADGLRLRLRDSQLKFESKLKTYSQSGFARLRQFFQIRLEILMGRFFMRFGMKTGDTLWSEYKQGVINNSDYKKFDGMLRQVISGTSRQREELSTYLENLRQQNRCVYGLHISDSTLVTCLIANRAGEHYHFVDGADGGYAMAAAAMKKQLHNLSQQAVDNS